MIRTPPPHPRPTDAPCARVVLAMVAGLMAVLWGAVIPQLRRRPDLALPLMRATRMLTLAAARHALRPSRLDWQDALGDAVLVVRDLLQRIVDEGACEAADDPASGAVRRRGPRAAPRRRHRTRLAARAIGPRARDGPLTS